MVPYVVVLVPKHTRMVTVGYRWLQEALIADIILCSVGANWLRMVTIGNSLLCPVGAIQ